ncbi:hypothetical protein SDC9_98835 [bioreactor metagenome]|uniref:Uncharacterized protein n=1 Tax=bioreactor metagenome TaxID=1076179 RepID=A0A645AFU1_9ZZZZ
MAEPERPDDFCHYPAPGQVLERIAAAAHLRVDDSEGRRKLIPTDMVVKDDGVQPQRVSMRNLCDIGNAAVDGKDQGHPIISGLVHPVHGHSVGIVTFGKLITHFKTQTPQF